MSGLDKQTIDIIRRIFNELDKDGSGSISVEEFQVALEDEGSDMSKEEIIALVKKADTDGDGEIDFNEFLKKFEGGGSFFNEGNK